MYGNVCTAEGKHEMCEKNSAEIRIRPYTVERGCITEVCTEQRNERSGQCTGIDHENIGGTEVVQKFLEAHESTLLKSGTTIGELVRRPELDYEMLAEIDKNRPQYSAGVREQVNINIKYQGYIRRQMKQVEQFKKMENKRIPKDINYDEVGSLRIEAVQKLKKFQPLSIGQASRISGVSPADISVLLVYLESRDRK